MPEGLETVNLSSPDLVGLEPEFASMFDDPGLSEPSSDTAASESSSVENLDEQPTEVNLDEPEEEAKPEETAETPEPEKPVEAEAKPPEQPESDDYKLREKNGKKEWVFDEPRGRKVYGAYKTAQAVEDVLGEPLNVESVKDLVSARDAVAQMEDDYLSGDPGAVTRFIADFLVARSNEAINEGRTPNPPIVEFARQFVPQLAANDPQTFNALIEPYLRADLDALYERAVRDGNDNLILALQHVENAKYGKYTPAEEAKRRAEKPKEDPREAELKTLRERLDQQEQAQKRAQFTTWDGATKLALHGEAGEAAKGVLTKEVLDRYPVEIQGQIAKALNEAIRKDLADDKQLQEALLTDRRRAMSGSEEYRSRVRQDMIRRVQVRAQRAAERRMPSVLQASTGMVKTASQQKHGKLAAAQEHRDAGASGASARKAVATQDTARSFTSFDDIDKLLADF